MLRGRECVVEIRDALIKERTAGVDTQRGASQALPRPIDLRIGAIHGSGILEAAGRQQQQRHKDGKPSERASLSCGTCRMADLIVRLLSNVRSLSKLGYLRSTFDTHGDCALVTTQVANSDVPGRSPFAAQTVLSLTTRRSSSH